MIIEASTIRGFDRSEVNIVFNREIYDIREWILWRGIIFSYQKVQQDKANTRIKLCSH